MLEIDVTGNRQWTKGFLTELDVRFLEDFDWEMRIRHHQHAQARDKEKSYEELVEANGDRTPTHCEHGIPLYRKCGICRALLG